jgi:hypothetical protein
MGFGECPPKFGDRASGGQVAALMDAPTAHDLTVLPA